MAAEALATDEIDPEESPVGAVAELRLALVCYGGVSLAIYMHGITKEIERLAVASAAIESGVPRDELPDTARVYHDLLTRLSAGEVGHRAGVRTRVVVDVISGTSAGGINGICLAKTLATNRPQDPLKRVWFERGDIRTLLRGWPWLPTAVRLPWFVFRSLVRPHAPSPLRGQEMCAWLAEAFAAVDDSEPALPGVETLMPRGHDLELFVPITDFRGYDRRIPLEDPRFVADRTHRHIMTFRHRDGERNDFTGDHNHALAFAARATSSFPGAFPAVSVGDYGNAVAGGGALRRQLPGLFPHHELAGVDAARTQFVDGGVLDNKPFGSTIDAIRERRASVEVDRRLLYIEPDPSESALDLPTGEPPGWLGTIWGSVATIPRQEPILDDLLALGERNETVGRIRDIIETGFDTIREEVTRLVASELGWKLDDPPAEPTSEELVGWRSRLADRAAADAGFSYATYLRLRVRLLVDSYARLIADVRRFPADSYHAAFVRAVWRRRARDVGLFAQDPAGTAAQQEFLDRFDLDYHVRRIRFLVAAINWWYERADEPGFPNRDELDSAKARLYDRLDELRGVLSTLARDEAMRDDLATAFSTREINDVELYREVDFDTIIERHDTVLDAIRDRLQHRIAGQLPGIERQLYDDLVDMSRDWPSPIRTDLLVRYLGFPFWDVLVYPVEGLAGVAERDHVEVLRISPLDVRLLAEPGAGKLVGSSIAHFGAFFSRPGREGDYLWGRLDAAERLVTLLLDDPHRPGTGDADPAECARAFRAVLDAERGELTEAGGLVEDLDARVRRLG